MRIEDIQIRGIYICKQVPEIVNWDLLWTPNLDLMVGRPAICTAKQEDAGWIRLVDIEQQDRRHWFLPSWIEPFEEKDDEPECKCQIMLSGCTCGAIRPYREVARERGIWI